MKQTKVNDSNRLDYYRTVYPVLNDHARDLIDISQETNNVVAIDCCGWYYSQTFSKKITMLETMFTVKNYKLNPDQFTKMVDNRDNRLVWPLLPGVVDPVILLDRSPLLKYHNMSKFRSIILDIIEIYRPIKLLIRGSLQFIDDSRLRDRIQSWHEFFPLPGYVTAKFLYDCENMLYVIDLKKCQ